MKKLESGVIKKVVLQLGEKEVSLTLDEARQLHAALSEMFEQKIVREEHHHYPHWYWSGPTIWPTTITVGPTITPTITPTTTPIWYSSSGALSAQYDSGNSTLNMAIH